MKNIMLIGLGPHSKRIYFPLIEKYEVQNKIKLVAIGEISSKKKETEKYLKEKGKSIETFYTNYKIDGEFILSDLDKKNLLTIIKKEGISAIILSTDPLSHKAYLEFAIENGISVLTDKPITTEINASIKEDQAKKIFRDFETLIYKYKKGESLFPNLIVSCLSQRRYHPAINKIKREITNMYERSGCPVTSIMCEHSDGQWRMPNEVIEESYHGYKMGVGKCSHSGYHFFDIMHWISDLAKNNEKKYDKITCYSSFTRPSDWINQFNMEDYKKLFGLREEKKSLKLKQQDFIKKTKNFGEIDAHINFTFYRGEYKIFNIQFSLLHNGFSRRSWIDSKNDLYKGNGRVRHEYYSIHQGPFQSIKYESYQSDQIENDSLKGSGDVGGELHSDVLIFRNSKSIGLDLPPLEKIQFGIVNEEGLKGYSRGHQEDARAECFKEFLLAINGEIPKGKLKSSIEDHFGSVALMSLSYLSAAKYFQNKNPIAEFKRGVLL